MTAPRMGATALALLLVSYLLPCAESQQALRLGATLSIEKDDNKEKTHQDLVALLAHAKDKKMEGNVVRYLDFQVQQVAKMLDASKTLEQAKAQEVPNHFTPTKYRVKSMPKLQAKKMNVKKITATDLRKRLQDGKSVNFDTPMLVTNATSLFEQEDWNDVRRHWSAARIAGDEYLEEHLKIEYWQPEKARARLVGNMLVTEEPDMVTFSKFLIICFHGSPAKPKLPGQNTEHCEQNVDAQSMIRNQSELKALNIFPEIKNALPLQAAFRKALLDAAGSELGMILGKGAERWKKKTGKQQYQYFTFGPSGSGDKLHAENGLPFFDVLIHGHRRWLLMKEDEMQRVAEKAREALEFDKTSAYMFFEEKLPELKEEFGLKKYIEINQEPGDIVIVPSGWFRVSVSLADSISYYQTILSERDTLTAVTDNTVWRPQFRQYQLAYCYDPSALHKLPDMEKGSQLHNWLKGAIEKVKLDELLPGILNVLLQCGSVIALGGSMPELDVSSVSVCTPEVWKHCRSRLVEKLEEKGGNVPSLAWLPKEAPKSVEELGSQTTAAIAPPSGEL